MKKIEVERIAQSIERICGQIACVYDSDILASICKGRKNESSPRSIAAMDTLVQNAQIAVEERIPICQDTGLAIVYLKIGQDVALTGGSLYEAVNRGVRNGYLGHFLRASSVDDPIYERKNTKDNTPAIIYTDIVDGDCVTVRFTVPVVAKNGKAEGFVVAGPDRVFHRADGEVKDGCVVLRCSEVKHPMAVRYGWSDNPTCNVYGAGDMPLSPFRTDRWKVAQ